MTGAGARLRLDEWLWESMLAHLRSVYPQEGCGLLAVGPDGETVTTLHALRNIATNPHVHYEAESLEVLEAWLAMRRAGAELGAIYHSHPTGPAYPSAEDVAGLAFFPSMLMLIVSLARPARPEVGLFAIRGGQIERRQLLLATAEGKG